MRENNTLQFNQQGSNMKIILCDRNFKNWSNIDFSSSSNLAIYEISFTITILVLYQLRLSYICDAWLHSTTNLTKYEIQALLDKIHQTIVVVGNDAGWWQKEWQTRVVCSSPPPLRYLHLRIINIYEEMEKLAELC